ncbi:GntR family transcriptional regulator [Kribbella sp. NPDC050459]|uniref:GntR family transcriptional regulator n=1 Tax=Kribbella sp. NPDC050459 TaxID=3155785 RepID=UPI0034075D1B
MKRDCRQNSFPARSLTFAGPRGLFPLTRICRQFSESKGGQMTTRQDAAERARRLVAELRAEISRGKLAPGVQIPAASTLARRYQLSRPTALKALQPLIDDGTLRVVSSVGIFVAEPSGTRSGCYVLLVESLRSIRWITHAAVRGFEERITQRGGRSIVLDLPTLLDPSARSRLPAVLGVFVFTEADVTEAVLNALDTSIPVATYLAGAPPAAVREGRQLTYVDVDNVAGGSLATADLLRDGHTDVFFVGLHIDGQAPFPWSAQRAEGWARTLRRHSRRARLACVQPPRHEPGKTIRLAAAAAVEPALQHSACVGADDLVMIALSQQLSASGIPSARWPIMVGFEGLPEAADLVTTSVRPRWEQLGAKAADQLFDGSRGRPHANGTVALAPMSLVSRPFVANRAP